MTVWVPGPRCVSEMPTCAVLKTTHGCPQGVAGEWPDGSLVLVWSQQRKGLGDTTSLFAVDQVPEGGTGIPARDAPFMFCKL